jgi:hypothetical protein
MYVKRNGYKCFRGVHIICCEGEGDAIIGSMDTEMGKRGDDTAKDQDINHHLPALDVPRHGGR